MGRRFYREKFRMVVMRPEVLEFEYSGDVDQLSGIAKTHAETLYPDTFKSLHKSGGPVGDEYAVKVMEVCVVDPDGPAPAAELDDMIAPGNAA